MTTKDAADALMALCHHLLGDTSAGVHEAETQAMPRPEEPAATADSAEAGHRWTSVDLSLIHI